MRVTINTPDGVNHELQSDQVTLNTEVGQMQILPGHISFLGSIIFSPVSIALKNHEEHFLLRQGFVMVDGHTDTVRLFAFAADKKESLDHDTINEYLNFVLSKLDKPEELNKFQVQFLTEQEHALKLMVEVTKENE